MRKEHKLNFILVMEMWCSKVYIVLVSCTLTTTSIESLLPRTSVSEVGVIASSIIQSYLPHIYDVRFICEETCVSNQILKTLRIPVMFSERNLRAGSFVFLLPRRQAFVSSALDHAAKSTTSKYVVILDCIECVSMEWIFQQSWQHQIVNIVVIPITNGTVPIYSYIPFKKGGCFDRSPVLLNKLTTMISSSDDLFPKRKLRNLHNCTLQVSSFRMYPGIYFESGKMKGRLSPVFNGLASSMNFNPEFIHTEGKEWTGSVSGPSKTGARGDVYLGLAHLGFHFFEPFDFRYLDYDSLAMTACISWCVAASFKKKPLWSSIVGEFSSCVWLMISLSAFGVLGVDHVVTKFNHGVGLSSNDMVMSAWAALLQGPGKVPRRYLIVTTRLLWFIWLMASLVLSTAYVGTLRSLLTAPHTDFAVRNFEDVANEGLRAYYPNGLADLVSGLRKSNPTFAKMQSKLVRFPADMFQSVLSLLRFKNTTCLMTDAMCRMLPQKHQDEVKLYSLPDEACLKVTPWHFFVLRKNSVFTEEVSVVLGRLTQAGIVGKSVSQYNDFLKVEVIRERPITISNLFPALFLLVSGLLISCVVFVFERMSTKRREIKSYLYGAAGISKRVLTVEET